MGLGFSLRGSLAADELESAPGAGALLTSGFTADEAFEFAAELEFETLTVEVPKAAAEAAEFALVLTSTPVGTAELAARYFAALVAGVVELENAVVKAEEIELVLPGGAIVSQDKIWTRPFEDVVGVDDSTGNMSGMPSSMYSSSDSSTNITVSTPGGITLSLLLTLVTRLVDFLLGLAIGLSVSRRLVALKWDLRNCCKVGCLVAGAV